SWARTRYCCIRPLGAIHGAFSLLVAPTAPPRNPTAPANTTTTIMVVSHMTGVSALPVILPGPMIHEMAHPAVASANPTMAAAMAPCLARDDEAARAATAPVMR